MRAVPGSPCISCTSQVQAAQAVGTLRGHSPSWAMHRLSGGWSQAVTFLADMNHPGPQDDVVSDWQPARNLLGDVVSGTEISAASYLQALAILCPLFCLWGGRALNSSQLTLLRYLFNPLFCERTRGHHVALEPFTGKVLFILFYFLSL